MDPYTMAQIGIALVGSSSSKKGGGGGGGVSPEMEKALLYIQTLTQGISITQTEYGNEYEQWKDQTTRDAAIQMDIAKAGRDIYATELSAASRDLGTMVGAGSSDLATAAQYGVPGQAYGGLTFGGQTITMDPAQVGPFAPPPATPDLTGPWNAGIGQVYDDLYGDKNTGTPTGHGTPGVGRRNHVPTTGNNSEISVQSKDTTQSAAHRLALRS